MARRRKQQQLMRFLRWGGKRQGAGRKPNGQKAGVSHRQRSPLASRFPIHVTLRLDRGLPRLRRKAAYAVLRRCISRSNDRVGFRLCQYSVLNNHLHLIVEAKGRSELSRGMQGLCVRIARGLNRLWGRSGRVFSDRYHDHVLRTPKEVRHALSYVLNNARRHRIGFPCSLDLFTSGPWFDGWRSRREQPAASVQMDPPTARARTWLLNIGWRRHGLLSAAEVPGP